MPNVEWSHEVEREAFQLSQRTRAELLRIVDLLRLYPEMGQAVFRGRFRGSRRIYIRPQWWLYYRLVDDDRNCLLTSIRNVRRRPV